MIPSVHCSGSAMNGVPFDRATVLGMFPPTMKTSALLLTLLTVTLCARANLVTKSVVYEQGGVKLESYLAYDGQTTALRPGVLVVPEWWGLNDYAKGRARELAQLDYVALAVDMYGGGEVTTDPKKAGELSGQFYGKPLMAERAQAALDQLLKTGLVDEKKVAAIGFCFGGAVSQALAYSGAPLAGIVSFHGSLVPASPEAAAKNRARFLICHGGLDPFTKPETIAAFKKSLDDGKIDYQFVTYSGALHSFTNPEADAIAAATGLQGIGYNAAAARRSWQLMRQFFEEIFATK
jgi:dienelactone hydrolase